MHRIVCREIGNQLFDRRLRRVCRKVMRKRTDPRLFAPPDLIADIDLRRGIFPDQYDRQTDFFAICFFKPRRLFPEFRADLRRDLFPVDQVHLLMIPPKTPFTKSADRSVEYLRASAVASDTDTTGGTSSR